MPRSISNKANLPDSFSAKKLMNSKKIDYFAQIAATRVAYRADVMHCPEPAPVPDLRLPLEAGSAPEPYEPYQTLRSAGDLRDELFRMRERYAPFLADLAPSVEYTRCSRALNSFDWRMETDADRRDFGRVFRGEGEWTPVAIPHYGGPVGNHTSYYRARFRVSPEEREPGRVFLRFKAVDYIAEVYLNQRLLGTHEGFFAPFEFDATPWLSDGDNVLLVVVHNRAKPEKIYAATGIGWDEPGLGWHHCPPGMGIWQDVLIEGRPPVHVHQIFVRPLLEESCAEAWVELSNTGAEPKAVALEISVHGQNFSQTVIDRMEWKPGCTFTVGFGDSFQEARAIQRGVLNQEVELPVEPGLLNQFRIRLDLPDCRRWSPEEPWLYQIQVRVIDASRQVRDAAVQQFGMRSFSIDDTEEPKGRFLFNGEPIRLRGANTMGYMQGDVARKNWDQLVEDILLAKIANMNFLRLTQRPVQPEIYDYCDRLGMMTQTDLPLFGTLPRAKFTEVVRQAGEMERLIRPHACNIMVSYINEPVPNSENKPQLFCSRADMERFFSACDIVVRELNPDRAIKYADGDYDPPVPGYPDRHIYGLWYNGHGGEFGRMHRGYGEPIQRGWFYGCGEFGAEGLDPADVMREHYPREWLPWSPEEDAEWTPHRIARAQSGNFHYFFYDTPRSLTAWIAASQAWQAWAMGMQMRAFRRQNLMNSSAIHLFIDAWPAGWMKAIMDVKRQPKPAFFAYREALVPLRVDLRTDRFAHFAGEEAEFEAWIYNDRNQAPAGCRLAYSLWLDGALLAGGECAADVPVGEATAQGRIAFRLPDLPHRTALEVRLALLDSHRKALHEECWHSEVWPASMLPLVDARIWTPHPGTELAESLHRLGAQIGSDFDSAEAYLFEGEPGIRAYAADLDRVAARVQQGARAIFASLPPGSHAIGADEVTVRASSMNALHFASRDTCHPWVEGFQPGDFKHWFHEGENRIVPFLPSTFTAERFIPVLASGNVNAEGEWGPALAVGERQEGSGSWVVCQIDLAYRINSNPAARMFVARLFTTG